jgi:hypothetical protein
VRSLPFTARVIAAAVTESVQAASAGDAEAFDQATERLATLDREQVRVLLGTVVRSLLEESHPDGIDGDDLQDVLRAVITSTESWFAADPGNLVVVLAGSLTAADPDALQKPPDAADLLRHAAVVIAALLRTAPRPLGPVLTDAFADLRRAETLDYP